MLIVALTPLRLGRDEADNEVRLATLLREIPKLKPAFPWLPEDGLTLAALEKQLKAHHDARLTLERLSGDEKEAHRKLREARADSYALWSDADGKLDAWVITNVADKDQYAFGRERRQRPRPARPSEKDKAKEAGAGGEKKPAEAPGAGEGRTGDVEAKAGEPERKTG